MALLLAFLVLVDKRDPQARAFRLSRAAERAIIGEAISCGNLAPKETGYLISKREFAKTGRVGGKHTQRGIFGANDGALPAGTVSLYRGRAVSRAVCIVVCIVL